MRPKTGLGWECPNKVARNSTLQTIFSCQILPPYLLWLKPSPVFFLHEIHSPWLEPFLLSLHLFFFSFSAFKISSQPFSWLCSIPVILRLASCVPEDRSQSDRHRVLLPQVCSELVPLRMLQIWVPILPSRYNDRLCQQAASSQVMPCHGFCWLRSLTNKENVCRGGGVNFCWLCLPL